jgi:hypothetical protein
VKPAWTARAERAVRALRAARSVMVASAIASAATTAQRRIGETDRGGRQEGGKRRRLASPSPVPLWLNLRVSLRGLSSMFCTAVFTGRVQVYYNRPEMWLR